MHHHSTSCVEDISCVQNKPIARMTMHQDSEPLNGRTIIRSIRIAMCIMFETLTQEQNGV